MYKIKRFIAFIIDLNVVSLIGILLTYTISFLIYGSDGIFDGVSLFFYPYIFITYVALLLKDLVFKNASIGKKIMKLMVINKAGEIPAFHILILRNAFGFIWPINAIIFLKFKNKIEDLVLKTIVIEIK